MKSIPSFVLSFLFYITFIGYFIITFPLYYLLLIKRGKKRSNLAHEMNRIWGYLITWPFGVRILRVDHKKLDPKGVYVFAPNHTSYIDIPVCNTAIPNTFRFLGKAELSSYPFFGWMFGRLHISVKRERKMAAFKSYQIALEKIKEDTSVLIFPEGTIPDKNTVKLGRFKDGAFKLAIETGVPIVPITIIGANKVMFDDGWFILKPGKIFVIFSEPISTTGMGQDDIKILKQKVFDIIEDTIDEYAPDHLGKERKLRLRKKEIVENKKNEKKSDD